MMLRALLEMIAILLCHALHGRHWERFGAMTHCHKCGDSWPHPSKTEN